jgi:transcriptional regulator with XRE-family HTH domain
MEFNEKLSELRRQKGLTQEEVAEALFVSRTAVSKWESGRGYPNIESLKGIARLFGVTVDGLLSGDELLSLAEADNKHKENRFRDLVFGLLDLCALLLLFLPLFAERVGEGVSGVSLLALAQVAPYLKLAFYIFVGISALFGVLTLAFQSSAAGFWVRSKTIISLIISATGVLLFILGLHPYAAVFLFVFLCLKALLLIKLR